nr:hypothetical protein [Tanacetum cinerariifolium]
MPMIEEAVKAYVVTEEVIKESVKAHVVNKVKNFMRQYLQDALAKTPISCSQSSSQHQSTIEAANTLSELELKNIPYHKMHQNGLSESHPTHEELFIVLLWLIELDENRSNRRTKHDLIMRKRDRADDDKDKGPSAGSNQVKEPIFEMGTYEAELPSSGANDEHPSLDADVDQPSPADDPNPKINIKEWFRDASSHEPQDPHWNTIKMIDDGQEQPWFNEKVNAAKEVLVGPVFNLLKGTCKSYGELEYNVKECFQALTDQLDWTNPEGYDHPVDMSKPLPLIEKDGRL